MQWTNQRLGRQQRITDVVWRDSLPRNANGKILEARAARRARRHRVLKLKGHLRMSAAEYWFDSHDGLRLFSRVYPGPAAGAPVVVCLHGLMRNGRDFEELAAHLAARCRVIVPDVRGRGLSARDPNFNNYQIPIYLRDLLLLLTGLAHSA